MYSPEIISQIHNQLQALDSSALVLLGGSYVYGEAGEESDVDFYWLCPSWRVFFLSKLKKQIKDLRKQFPDIDFSVMIVPKWLRRHEYYIYGRDVNRKIYTWGLPNATLIRNCLKLAYYNHLRSIVEPKGKERNVQKVKKQLAVAQLATEGKIDFNKPIFSWNYIRERQSSNPPSRGAHGGCKTCASLTANEQSVKHESHTPATPTDVGAPLASRHTRGDLESVETVEGGIDEPPIVEMLAQAYSQLHSYFTFSWSNYLLYNIRFLLRGNPLFLFKNPDKMIIKRLKEGFDNQEDPMELYKEIKEVIFPVIIL